MAKGRKNGCPVNIKNWLVYILDPSTSDYVRIFGLNSLTTTVDSDTEDGSASTDIWSEPYVSKRNGSASLEAKKTVDELTGVPDAGQELLNWYAEQAGCDADATLKFIDAYGHAFIADYIVTSREDSVDDSGDTYSWDLEQVGEAEVLPYVHVTSVGLKDGSTAISSTLSMAVNATPKIITVDFTPANSSNQRYRVTNSKRSVAVIGNVTEDSFTITPVAAGTTNITVTSVEGGKTVTVALTVTESA